jgi:hypothetical protein
VTCNDIAEFMQHECPECTRLWLEYAVCAIKDLSLQLQLRDPGVMLPVLAAAAKEKQERWRLIDLHCVACPGWRGCGSSHTQLQGIPAAEGEAPECRLAAAVSKIEHREAAVA